jgi:hypothetical protein
VAKPSAAPRRLQSLLIWGGGTPDVHVPLIAGEGQGPTPAVAEAGGTTPERMGENVAAVCWGWISENPDKIPEHRRRVYASVQVRSTYGARGDKESPKDCLKSCESLDTCPRAPFIGRRRDFYIPKVPSNLRNIPNVNMYMNVLYIPYIYKPATSSHIKPGLLRRRL